MRLFWGESPRVVSPFPLVESLDKSLLSGLGRLYLGATRERWPDVDIAVTALSPGAFRLQGAPGTPVSEAPWTVRDVAPFLLAALGQRQDILPSVGVRTLIRSLPQGPAVLVGGGAPLEVMGKALTLAGRVIGEAGTLHPSVLVVGRRPPSEALAAAVSDSLGGSVLLHTGLLEELPSSVTRAALRKGMAIVGARWGDEGDVLGGDPRQIVLLPDSPLRLRSLLARLRRSEGRPKADRSPGVSA